MTPTATSEGAPPRLLLVDDVAQTRTLVRTAVRLRGGFEVVGEAASGAEAVALAGSVQPDVVLLDLGLPDATGPEVLTRIRAARPDVKVVVYSGAERSERAWADPHVDAAVAKDSDLGHLMDVLETVAGSAGSSGPSARTIELPADLVSVAEARRFVFAILAEHRAEDVLDSAYLVVSELAANAILHARTSYRVDIRVSSRSVRVAVIDQGPGTPEPRPYDVTAESGRGLHLVAALSQSWGIDSSSAAKTVWAELPRS